MFGRRGYTADWLTAKTAWLRRGFQFLMIAVLAIGYGLINKSMIDSQTMMIIFLVLFGVLFLLTNIIESQIWKHARSQMAQEYCAAHPDLSEDIREGLLQGRLAHGMSAKEAEIATGLRSFMERGSEKGEENLVVAGQVIRYGGKSRNDERENPDGRK